MNLVSDWGIDVSHYDAIQYNGSYKPMDWTTAHAQGGIGTAFIKASEGTDYTDLAFPTQWAAAKAAGEVRAAYHFLRSNKDGAAQADYFLGILYTNGFTLNDFIAMDFETRDGENGTACLACAHSFMTEVEKVIPASHMLLYTGPSFWQEAGGCTNAPWGAEYKLWIAQWPKDYWISHMTASLFNTSALATFKQQIDNGVYLPPALKPWTSPAAWQFTSRVSPSAIPGYAGVKKAVDYDAIYPPFLGSVTPPIPYLNYKTTVNVNVRSGAGDTDPIIGITPANTVITTENPTIISGKRTHALTPIKGWIYSAYLIKI